MPKTNLHSLATKIANLEKGERKKGTPQILEVLGVIGVYWRDLASKGKTEQILRDVACIVERAGKRSARKLDYKDKLS